MSEVIKADASNPAGKQMDEYNKMEPNECQRYANKRIGFLRKKKTNLITTTTTIMAK